MANITVDLGILSLFNQNTPTQDQYTETQSNFLHLLNELLKLKQKTEQELIDKPEEAQIYDFEASKFEVSLPKKITIFPRHKKIPIMTRQKTRWENFAATKGIQKKKRSRMVFDENKADWVPRWGARSIKKNKNQEEWAIELQPGERDNADPFKTKGLGKELKNEKENLKRFKNEERKKGKKGGFRKDAGGETREKKKKANKKTLEVAQVSTASLGKFDKKSHNKEPKIKAKIHHTKPNFTTVKDERRRDLDILKIISKNS